MDVRHNDSGQVIIVMQKSERAILAQALEHAAKELAKQPAQKTASGKNDEKLSKRQAAAILYQVCTAVKAEHEIGIRYQSGVREVSYLQLLDSEAANARNPIVDEDDDEEPTNTAAQNDRQNKPAPLIKKPR